MKTYSLQVRPRAQGNLCCQHTFTVAARPGGEVASGEEKVGKIVRIIRRWGKNLLLDVLISKHCCLISFHLLQPVHTSSIQLVFPIRPAVGDSPFALSSPHQSSLPLPSASHQLPLTPFIRSPSPRLTVPFTPSSFFVFFFSALFVKVFNPIRFLSSASPCKHIARKRRSKPCRLLHTNETWTTLSRCKRRLN